MTRTAARARWSYYEQKVSRPAYCSVAAWIHWTAACRNLSWSASVSEAQMTALFGKGRHPNADVIERRLQHDGVHGRALGRATKLGHAYHLFEPSEFETALATRYREFNVAMAGHRRRRSRPASGRGSEPSWRGIGFVLIGAPWCAGEGQSAP
jgi:hypothetical protein